MATITSPILKDSTGQSIVTKLEALTAMIGGNANIAPEFNTSTNYRKDDIVMYNKDLYVFTADHAAGAWTGSDAMQTDIGSEVSDLRSGSLVVFTGTQAEWNALSTTEKKRYNRADFTDDYVPSALGNLNSLTTSDKSSAVAAINELNSTKQPKTDNTLQTTSKTVPGAINELKSGLTNLIKSAEFTVTTDARGNAKLTSEFRNVIGVYAYPTQSTNTLCRVRSFWLNSPTATAFSGTYIEVNTTEDTFGHIAEAEVTGTYYYI